MGGCGNVGTDEAFEKFFYKLLNGAGLLLESSIHVGQQKQTLALSGFSATQPQALASINGISNLSPFNMKKTISVISSVSVLLAGCATSSKDIGTAYITPLQYQGYDCSQLTSEIQRIQHRVIELGGRLDQAAQNDKAIMGIGMILFWPALFALGGTKQQEAEYSRLKGEYEAIQQASVSKKCQSGDVAPMNGVTSFEQSNAPIGDVEGRLTLLRDLRGKGVLTEIEYITKRAEVVDSIGKPQDTKAVNARSTQATGLHGLRIRVRDIDPLTKSTSSEAILSIDSVSTAGATLNDGAVTLDSNGRVLTGTLPLPNIFGLGGNRLRPGLSTSVKYVINGAPSVDLEVAFLRTEQLEISGRFIQVVKCKVSGYASLDQPYGNPQSWRGALISGEVIIEPQTGLMLIADIKSISLNYSLIRSIQGVSDGAR